LHNFNPLKIAVPSMITFIGNVNLDRLAYLGKTISFPKKLSGASHIAVFLLFLSGLFFYL